MNFEKNILALQELFERSVYFDYLYRNISRIGFDFGNSYAIVNFNYESGEICFEKVDKKDETPIWIGISEENLEDLAKQIFENKSIITIHTSNSKRIIHPTIERIIINIFSKKNYINENEKEEIIYSSLFSFVEPVLICDFSGVKIYKYGNQPDGLDVYVTSGLFEKNKSDGCELMILADLSDVVMINEFINWTKYVVEKGKSILRGDWLEYKEGKIPGTSLSGFIVVEPLKIPESFTIVDRIFKWNLLLGVTNNELELAKRKGVYEVAQKIFENGYIDYTPILRNDLSGVRLDF